MAYINIFTIFTSSGFFTWIVSTIHCIFDIICFLLIDNKVINLLENEAEVIKNVPVNVIYNEEAYVVEDVPSTIDIIITGIFFKSIRKDILVNH